MSSPTAHEIYQHGKAAGKAAEKDQIKWDSLIPKDKRIIKSSTMGAYIVEMDGGAKNRVYGFGVETIPSFDEILDRLFGDE